MKRRAGFTLVELLIVMAVIAALMATLTPVAVGAVKKAKATQVASNLRNLAVAAQQYIYVENPDDPTTISTQTLLDGDYIDKDPGSSYDLTVYDLGGGEYEIRVYYTGNDVATELLYDIDSSIDVSDPASIMYKLKAIKYW